MARRYDAIPGMGARQTCLLWLSPIVRRSSAFRGRTTTGSGPTRLAAAALVVSLLVPFALSGGAAGADTVGDRRAQAQRLAAQLDALTQRSSQLVEAYNQAHLRLDQLNTKLDAAKAALGMTDGQLNGARSRVRDMAVESYMQGGGVKQLSLLIPSSSNEIGVRSTYVKSVTANTNDAVDALHQAHVELSHLQGTLVSAQADAAKAVAALQASQKQAADAEASTRAAYASAQAQLGEAVLAQAVADQTAASQARIERQIAAGHDPLPVRLVAQSSPSRSSSGSTGSGSSTGSGGATAPAASSSSPPPPSSGAQAAIAEAQRQLGKPYVYGGSGPDNYDCSGLTAWAWGHAGHSLPHSAADQYYGTTHVSVSQLQPGDLVFWGNPPHHVGIYVGNGQMINALHSGTNVRYESIYEESDLIGGGRIN
ncbi:MAG: C40 family peptidase [Acidimicrobiales bacterium]